MRIANPNFQAIPSWRWQLRMPRFRVFPKRPASEWVLFATILFYVIIGVFVYFWLVQPWIGGQIDVRIGADSDRIWKVVESSQENGVHGNLVSFGANMLGPVAEGLLLKHGLAIMCFNVFLFLASLRIAFSFPGINKSLFGFLMLLNLELFPALTTLNKEILTLFAAVLIAKYIYSERRSKLLLLAVCAACLCARWEQLAIFLMFLFLYRWKRPKLILAGIILAITIAYPLAMRLLPVSLSGFISQGANGNTITLLNNIQARGGFPLVLIPKIIMTSVGQLGAPWAYWNGTFLGGANDIEWWFFEPLGCGAFVIVLCLAFFKGRMNLHRPIAFLVTIQMIVVATTPFVQPRYYYAVYILLCLELSLPRTLCTQSTEHLSPRSVLQSS